MSQPPVIAVVGPTAAGKSNLGVGLARALGGTVINADSMQLYVGLDIGTAKLRPAETGGVPHLLLDVWPVTRTANVAEYQHLARTQIERLRGRGTVPILVGGSGLYLRGALDEFEFPGTNEMLRAKLEAELTQDGPASLHSRLAAVDPVAAGTILPSNGRRIVRALEVVELTGKSFTARLPQHLDHYSPTIHLGIDVDRAVLDERIAARVDRMWDAGLTDEVRALEAQGLRAGVTASRALGYAQVLRFLSGEITEAEARDETVRATKRFARRQDSWFRRDPRIRWMPSNDPDLLGTALAHVDTVVAVA